jgi:hypothetical protein
MCTVRGAMSRLVAQRVGRNGRQTAFVTHAIVAIVAAAEHAQFRRANVRARSTSRLLPHAVIQKARGVRNECHFDYEDTAPIRIRRYFHFIDIIRLHFLSRYHY